jgi:DNA-directed RNA polymerase subunit RPC12/RpoP
MNLRTAYFCVECGAVFERRTTCPSCTCKQIMPLGKLQKEHQQALNTTFSPTKEDDQKLGKQARL